MSDVKTDINSLNLRDISNEGFIFLGIKAKDTEDNQKTHAAFREFCKTETDNNYTQGLRKLMEYYQSDFKYEMIYHQINDINTTLLDLKTSVVGLQNTPKKDDSGTF